VLITSTSVATPAKYSDLINKVTLLQNGVFRDCCLTAGLQIYLKKARKKARSEKGGERGEKQEARSEKGRT
jgi:hypothetical protein